jgi:serine/threonine protein phosphatase 1
MLENPKFTPLGSVSSGAAMSVGRKALLRRRKQPAIVPADCRVYAVGDIHGRLDLLRQLWQIVKADSAGFAGRKVIVFLGDYVDRGPDSKG